MKQTTIDCGFIISATLKHDIKQTILHEPRKSFLQLGEQFDVEPSDVIKCCEEIRSGRTT